MTRPSQVDPVHESPEADGSSQRPPISRDRVPVSSSCLMRYGVAVLATAAALLFRLSLDAVLEDRMVFLPFTLALLVSAWYGGLGPGLLATGLGACVTAFVLLPPRWTPTVALLADGLSLVVFALVGLGMSALVEQLHRAHRRAEAEAAKCQAAEEARRAHERFIQQMTDLSPVVLDVFDLVTGRHTYFSGRSVNLFGYTSEEMTQMPDKLSVLVHPDDMPRLADNMARLTRLADGEIHEFECRVRRRDGEWRWVAARSMVFARTEQGEVRQTVNAAFDVTERKHAEEALRHAHDELEQRVRERTSQLTAINAELIREITERQRAEEELRRSETYLAEGQRLTHTGSWAWHVASGALFWSLEHFRILGLDPESVKPSYPMALQWIHPEDRSVVQQTFERAIRERSDCGSCTSSVRIILPPEKSGIGSAL
jgi:PAS domain S-box-containing protein